MVFLYAWVILSRMRLILSLGLVRLLTHRAGHTAGTLSWSSRTARRTLGLDHEPMSAR